MLSADHPRTRVIRTDTERPNTSPAVACDGLPGGVSTTRDGHTIGGGASGCRRNTSQHLANYLSMDEQQLCEMSRREAAVAEADCEAGEGRGLEEGVVKTRGITEQNYAAGVQDNGGASPSISLPPSPRDCDVLGLDSTQSIREGTPSPDIAPPEAELQLDEGRSSVLGSSRRLRGDSSRSGWTSSGDITELKPRRNSKTFRLPPPPLTTPPATPPGSPPRGRISPPHTPPFDAEDDGVELEGETRYELTQEKHEKREAIEREQELRRSVRSRDERMSRDGVRVNRDFREVEHDGDYMDNNDIDDQEQRKDERNNYISEMNIDASAEYNFEHVPLPRTSILSASMQLPPLAPMQNNEDNSSQRMDDAAKSLDMALSSNPKELVASTGQEWSTSRDIDLSIDLNAVHSTNEEEIAANVCFTLIINYIKLYLIKYSGLVSYI